MNDPNRLKVAVKLRHERDEDGRAIYKGRTIYNWRKHNELTASDLLKRGPISFLMDLH